MTRIPAFAARIPRPVFYLVTFVTSSYLLTTYLISKLAAMHTRMTEEANSKDGLKKRFQQNQNDIAFTVMALLPTLAKGVNENFDVDDVTQRLKSIGDKKTANIEATATAISSDSTKPASDGPTSDSLERLQATASSKEAAPSQNAQEVTSPLDAVAEPKTSLPPPHATLLTEQVPPTQNPDPSQQAVSQNEPDPVYTSGTGPAHINGSSETRSSQEGESSVQVKDGGQADSVPAATIGNTDGTLPPQPTLNDAQSNLGLPTPDSTGSTLSDTTSVTGGERTVPEDVIAEAEQRKAKAEEEKEAKARAAEALEEAQRQALADERLRQEQLEADRKQKLELWQELKIVSISRTLTSVYAVNLLSMLTHLQLNLLGRYAYLSSLSGQGTTEQEQSATQVPLDPFEDAWMKANSAAASTPKAPTSPLASTSRSISPETEERFLTFSWYFLHHGCHELSQRVRAKVEEVMTTIPLKTQLNHAETLAVLSRIKRKIDYEYETEGQALTSTPPGSSTPRFVPSGSGGSMLASDGGEGPSKMAFGAESLLPNGFHGFEDDSMSMSVMSGSTSRLGGRRRRRKVNLFSYLLPSTPEGDVEMLCSSGLIPGTVKPRDLRAFDGDLASLLDETRDILESKDANKVLKKCVSASFEVLVESLRAPFGLGPSSSAPADDGSQPQFQGRFQELHSVEEEEEVRRNQIGGRRLKLAAILPLLARQSSLALDSVPNEFVDAIGTVKDLKALSAIIYSSWTTTPQ